MSLLCKLGSREFKKKWGALMSGQDGVAGTWFIFWNTKQPGSCRRSVPKSCPTLLNPTDCSTPGPFTLHSLRELAQIHVHWVSDPLATVSSSVIPFSFCPQSFPSIRVFSNDSALCIRWPKYWSFNFSISPSNEYSGLISFWNDWFNLFAVQGTLKSLLQQHKSKAANK